MSVIKPTQRAIGWFRTFLSCTDWVYSAVGFEKKSGNEGFANFWSGYWYYPMHYKHICRDCPSLSSSDALCEMAYYRERMVGEILTTAGELDAMLMRLQKMDDEISSVLERKKGSK